MRKKMGGWVRARIRRLLRERDGDSCHWCGGLLFFPEPHQPPSRKNPDFASIEHIIPLCEGGSYELGNLALAHERCNHARNDEAQRKSA